MEFDAVCEEFMKKITKEHVYFVFRLMCQLQPMEKGVHSGAAYPAEVILADRTTYLLTPTYNLNISHTRWALLYIGCGLPLFELLFFQVCAGTSSVIWLLAICTCEKLTELALHFPLLVQRFIKHVFTIEVAAKKKIFVLNNSVVIFEFQVLLVAVMANYVLDFFVRWLGITIVHGTP